MTAKILDEPYTNERDEMVALSIKAMTFDATISFVLSLEKTKMRIVAHLADESETNEGDVVAGGEPRGFDERFILLKEDKDWWVVHE